METVSMKLEEEFARTIEHVMKKHHYATKTEFIREALRDKVKELEKEARIARAKALHGTSKHKTSDEELHKAGEKAFEELEREI